MKKSENTLNLLNWWQTKLQEQCLMKPDVGYFVDQIWANYFPVFFEKVYILKEPGYNVGYWNFGERKIIEKDGAYFVNDTPLYFFHFSNYKIKKPEQISIYSEYDFDSRSDLKPLYSRYLQMLLANKHAEYSEIKPALSLRARPHPYKYFGMRVRAHGTRWFNAMIKFIFGV
jgi:hypothetical protein